MIFPLHSWLSAFAAAFGLKAQVEYDREFIYLVVGSAERGKVEVDKIEIAGLSKWSDLEPVLAERRGQYGEKIKNGLVKVREADGAGI